MFLFECFERFEIKRWASRFAIVLLRQPEEFIEEDLLLLVRLIPDFLRCFDIGMKPFLRDHGVEPRVEPILLLE